MIKTDDRIDALIRLWDVAKKHKPSGWNGYAIPATDIHRSTHTDEIFPMLQIVAPGTNRLFDNDNVYYEFQVTPDDCLRNILYKYILTTACNFIRFFTDICCYHDSNYATELGKIWAEMLRWARDNDIAPASLPVKRQSLKRYYEDAGYLIARVTPTERGVWGIRIK